MNNKIILGIALSLALSSFTPALLAEKTTADTTKDAVTTQQDTGDTSSIDTQLESDTQSDTSKPTVIIENTPEENQKDVNEIDNKILEYDFKGVQSLRGENGLNDLSFAAENKHLPADRLPIVRNYFQQPPLIPHRVREYKITTNHNKCLTCHSWKNYKKSKATKISQTHFVDREGNAQSTVAARRYFCNQCHVPQVDAKPLVENEFKPVDDLK